MKTMAKLLILLSAMGTSLLAQTNQAEIVSANREQIVSPKTNTVVLQATPDRIVGKRVAVSGPSVRALKTGKPLQLINPFAPARYGDGTGYVSRDLVTGRSQGVTLVSLEF